MGVIAEEKGSAVRPQRRFRSVGCVSDFICNGSEGVREAGEGV